MKRACVDVRDFGAEGDGVTDDTDAIQAAIDWVRANPGGLANASGRVVFPGGVYAVSSLDCTGIWGLELRGVSSWGAALYGCKQTSAGPVLDLSGSSSCLIAGLTVHGQQPSGQDPTVIPTVGILLADTGSGGHANKNRLDDVGSVGKFSKAAVYLYGQTDFLATGCAFQQKASAPALYAGEVNDYSAASPFATLCTGQRTTGELTFAQCEFHGPAPTNTQSTVDLRGVYSVRFYGGNNDCSGNEHVAFSRPNRHILFSGVQFYSESGTVAQRVFRNNGDAVKGLTVEQCDVQAGIGAVLSGSSGASYDGVHLAGRLSGTGFNGKVVQITTPGFFRDSLAYCDGLAVDVGAGGTVGNGLLIRPGTITAQTNNATSV